MRDEEVGRYTYYSDTTATRNIRRNLTVRVHCGRPLVLSNVYQSITITKRHIYIYIICTPKRSNLNVAATKKNFDSSSVVNLASTPVRF